MAGGWGCPHEVNDVCTKINDLPCDPGMKGCVLAGRYVFANEDKNERLRQKRAREQVAEPTDETSSGHHP
jgi:orotidine-5'-phosphate decarboxylase